MMQTARRSCKVEVAKIVSFRLLCFSSCIGTAGEGVKKERGKCEMKKRTVMVHARMDNKGPRILQEEPHRIACMKTTAESNEIIGQPRVIVQGMLVVWESWPVVEPR